MPELVLMEQRRIHRFIQGLNVELQEALAAIPIDTLNQVLEKAQRIKSAKLQVKAFQDRKQSYPVGQSSTSEPSTKMGRGNGGSSTNRESTSGNGWTRSTR